MLQRRGARAAADQQPRVFEIVIIEMYTSTSSIHFIFYIFGFKNQVYLISIPDSISKVNVFS